MALEEEVSLSRLRERRTLLRARVVASLQSLAIFLLLVAMSEDYSHNQYMQGWMVEHLGGLSFLFNGSLAAFYAGLMITFYLSKNSSGNVGPRLRKKEEIIVGPKAA